MLIFATPDKIKKSKYLLADQNYSWAYLGTNIRLKQRIGASLSDSQRYHYAAELNEIAGRLRADFVEWVSEIGSAESDKINWSSSLVASRSPIQNDLFLLWCYFLLSKKWIQEGIKSRLVVIENPWLLKDIEDNFKSFNPLTLSSNKYIFKIAFKKVLKTFLKTFSFTGKYLMFLLAMKFYKMIYLKKFRRMFTTKLDVIIYSWIEERCFKDNLFNDPYLGNLEQIYNDKSYNVARLTPISFPLHLAKKIFAVDSLIILLPAFLTVKNILRAAFMNFKTNKAKLVVNIYNLSNLWDFMTLYENSADVFNRNLLIYYTVPLMLKCITTSQSAVFVYPYENQGWEKVMLSSIKRTGKVYNSVGCQIAAIPINDVSYYLGKKEKSFAFVPDYIFACSDYYAELLRNMGQVSTILNAGSLRFKSKKLLSITSKGKNNCLILLSISLPYCLELIYFAISKFKDKDIKVFLKAHPDLPDKILRKYLKTLPDNFTFSNENLLKILENCSFVIYSATTAAIECLEVNKSVYKFRPELVDIDPIIGLDLSIPEIGYFDGYDNCKLQMNRDYIPDSPIFDRPNIDTWLGVFSAKTVGIKFNNQGVSL